MSKQKLTANKKRIISRSVSLGLFTFRNIEKQETEQGANTTNDEKYHMQSLKGMNKLEAYN